ncbi:MAG: hypothetical protein V4612_02670 [Pseudomonadota bacterium]
MTNFQEVISDFGFKSEAQQIALLQTLKIPKYLSRKELWEAVHLIGRFENPLIVFEKLDNLFKKYGVYEGDFEPEKLLTADIDIAKEDLQDLLTFFRQSAFNRNINQERNELVGQSWMEEHQEAFLAAAKTLGLIDEVFPSFEKYDETWVQGASRLKIESRLETLKSLTQEVAGTIRLLTGVRELWAELDGRGDTLDEKIADGKKYMLALAEKKNIKIDPENPFIQRAGRTYLNYASDENRRLNESDMAQDVADQMGIKYILINAEAQAGKTRATTATTSLEAALELKKLSIQNPKILVISDQPFLERQRLAVLFALLQCDIKDSEVDAVGNECRAGVAVINAELGALASEQYKFLGREESDFAALSYQNRVALRGKITIPSLDEYDQTSTRPSPRITAPLQDSSQEKSLAV